MTRCFTPAQRVALYLRSGGHCAICGCLLNPASWHADHRIPFAHGGPTELWNGQALCPPCNLLKSMDFDLNGVVPSGLELRPWQLQFLTRTDRRADGEHLGFLRHATLQATTPSDQERKAYVLNAFPGTGKTKAAFTGAKYLLMHNVVDTVIYLVPSDNLRKSAAD